MNAVPELGEVMIRIIPPIGDAQAYAQAGTVTLVTDDFVELAVQVDCVRRMRFHRSDGTDMAGLGSFLVAGKYMAAVLEQLRPVGHAVLSTACDGEGGALPATPRDRS